MCTNDFSSYFEIFAALNLAYAGFKDFREAINDDILSLHRTINQDIQSRKRQVEDKLNIAKISPYQEERLNRKIAKIDENYTSKSSQILSAEETGRNFVIGFKTMFLITSMFCFSILGLAGFEQFLSSQWQSNVIILILLATGIYNVCIFGRSFTKSANSGVRVVLPITVIALLNFVAYTMITFCPFSVYLGMVIPESVLIAFALIVAPSPFVFHFIKVPLHKRKYRSKMEELLVYSEGKLNEISDWLDFLDND